MISIPTQAFGAKRVCKATFGGDISSLFNHNLLSILDIDTLWGIRYLATLEVVVGGVVIVCFDTFNIGVVFPENTSFLLTTRVCNAKVNKNRNAAKGRERKSYGL